MSVADQVRDNRGELARIVERAAGHLARGQDEQAAVWAQIGASFGWMNHPGAFASDDLEAIVSTLAGRLPESSRLWDGASRGDRERVLHVATQLYETGGHTQTIRAWVDQDAGREHLVAVTRQGTAPTPPKMRPEAGSRGVVVALDRAPGGLLERAAALREAARGASIVVCHTHNYDVVPTLAFRGVDDLPSVVLIDNNDHTFWFGRGGTTLVMHLRHSGAVLARERRGIPAEHSHIHERPLRPRDRRRSRAEAKRSLGLPEDELVLATAADPTKYRPVDGQSFLGLVEPLLQAHPRLHLVAAGPGTDRDWVEAAERTGGRIHALGMIPDATPVHEAADVYLDSFPFSSLTSLLEAGGLETPVVTFRGHPAGCDVLGADTRGLDGLMLVPSTPEELRAQVDELLADADARHELGAATRAQILRTHLGPGWMAGTEALYERARAAGGLLTPGPATWSDGELDQLVALVMQRTGYARGVSGAVEDFAGLLRWPHRVGHALTAAGRSRHVPTRTLLGESRAARVAARRRGEPRDR